jgi:hypothetical protein
MAGRRRLVDENEDRKFCAIRERPHDRQARSLTTTIGIYIGRMTTNDER